VSAFLSERVRVTVLKATPTRLRPSQGDTSTTGEADGFMFGKLKDSQPALQAGQFFKQTRF
jgi:hypothetical protein